MVSLDQIQIKKFKSIHLLPQFNLRQLNILIGANGSGKSNFIEVFKLLRAIVEQNLEQYVLQNGGANDLLFKGKDSKNEMWLIFNFGNFEYIINLIPSVDEKLIINFEDIWHYLKELESLSSIEISKLKEDEDYSYFSMGSSLTESLLKTESESPIATTKQIIAKKIYDTINDLKIYHFHDTSPQAPMRRSEIVDDHGRLRPNAANLAPVLLSMKFQHKKNYQEIVAAIRTVIPFFDDFILNPFKLGEKEVVKLTWQQKGSDYPMQPYHLSDGTLRFICLITALLQPFPNSIIVIDEPELGLHPHAIEILAEYIKSASERMQVILSTQSPDLVSYFKAEDVIVVNRVEGESTFTRLKEEELKVWLEDYSLGQLWVKNVIDGGTKHE